jgi:hypothetical protein
MPIDRIKKKVKLEDDLVENELEMYLSKVSDRKSRSDRLDASFDPIKYWIYMKQQFPILFPVAVDFLNINLSSSSAERKFSRSKKIANPLKNCLLDETLALAIFLKK